jgi:hypothetical protein
MCASESPNSELFHCEQGLHSACRFHAGTTDANKPRIGYMPAQGVDQMRSQQIAGSLSGDDADYGRQAGGHRISG